MPCFHPLQCLRLGTKPNGKENIKIFKTRFKNYSALHEKVDLLLPCGQCPGCRLERSRQWAVRCVHEAEMYDRNCFITLTFNDESLWKRPLPMSLDKKEFPDFMKRLRWHHGNGIRVYYCGEYGDRYNRPHYHACLFNFNFSDLLPWKKVNDFQLYTSEALSELWPFGFSSVGTCTFESAAYCARYIMKKVNGKLAEETEFYRHIDFDTGETYVRVPEFNNMSRGGRGGLGGIGNTWFEKWGLIDVYPNDYIVERNRKMRPPRFYDSKIPDWMLKELKENRVAKALLHVEDQSVERLLDAEKCAIAKLRLFGRNVE